ncbi:hypothetical protein KGY73_05760 [bacterium]|nr:hypothetical protein [bacterium]
MNIIFYNNDYKNSDGKIDQIWKMLHEKNPRGHIISIHKPHHLKERLENFSSPTDIVFLICHDKEELKEILPAQNILKEVRVVLFLTQREDELVEMSQCLNPHFFGFLDGDFTELKQIIDRIFRQKTRKLSFSDPLRYTNWGVRSIL